MQILVFLLLASFVASAQTVSPTAQAYSVAYFDVLPASAPAAIALLKQYRDKSHSEPGYVNIELFQEVGRPGRFNIIEEWINSGAIAAHGAATSTKEMRSRLDAIRISDYDQRPYKPIAVRPSNPALTPAVYAQALHVVTHVDIGAQGTDAAALLIRLAGDSRKENGNLRFDVLQHTERENHFTVIEAWQSEKAEEAHLVAAHTRQYRNALAPISGSPLEERPYKAVE